MLYVDGIPTGTCRVFWDDQQQSYVIGRGAVRKAFKGNHYGTVLLKEAEKEFKRIGGAKRWYWRHRSGLNLFMNPLDWRYCQWRRISR
uniref:GNAT family N-acetyltransferase n=1 Tax=uncultured Allisonella sp. TaxID=339338 RepID=UPI00280546EE|nr:GNAT family N-acetyltransferase [uncultured Allisonella sp.]